MKMTTGHYINFFEDRYDYDPDADWFIIINEGNSVSRESISKVEEYMEGKDLYEINVDELNDFLDRIYPMGVQIVRKRVG